MATAENQWAWSTTAANNATADSAVNWAEGQDPATVNNSARAMMAAGKRMANVQSGNVTVGGTADAITVTTGQTIDSAHQALGFRICFRATGTNTGAATVAVDGLTAVAIKRPNGDALVAGDIVSGAFHDIAFDGTNYRLMVPGAGGSYGSLSGDNTWTGTNAFNGTSTTIGNDVADVVVIKGTTVHATMSALMSSSSLTAFRTAIGLPLGTSGATVPLMNGANTWSQTQRIEMAVGGNWIFSTKATDRTTLGSWISTYFFDGFNQVCGSITHNGGTGIPGNTTYGASSDGRFKTGKRPIDNSGDIIDALNPIYFKWAGQGNEDFGFVAQDIAAIPQIGHTIVKGDDDDPAAPRAPGAIFRPYQMQHGRLEAILVAEIQALRARVAALEAG